MKISLIQIKRDIEKLLYFLNKGDAAVLSKVELVKIASPFNLVEKTTNLLVHIHYFI